MTAFISCPQCSQPVTPEDRICDHCGVDLALAAALAERDLILPDRLSGNTPLAPEVLVPRIGETIREKGFVSSESLQRALDYQRQSTLSGRPVLLGQALLELKMIDRETLDSVVTEQILQLQSALRDSNRQLEQRVQERTQDLQRALERLSELNQLKSNFIANISHELRTPLTHLKGYLDLLSTSSLGPLTAQQVDALEVLTRSENRLEGLIEDLIQFSLVSRSDLRLEMQPVHLEPLIQVSVARFMPKAKASNISLEVALPGKVPAILADEEKLIWVIQQLLDNALKFTPVRGHVEVEVTVDADSVSLSVTDTGIGIPAGRIEEIFEPFHQLDGSATRRFGGTGLGLTMARRIVEAHGAQMKVKSVEGKGSRFEFALPVAAREPSSGTFPHRKGK